jgi:alpha-1,6-mannosyltransferase
VLLCTIGAMVKVPAFIGVVYIGWEWLGDDVPLRTRIRPTLVASAMAVAAMAAVSEMVGLGWGWVTALNNPGTVLSWLDPPTAVGLSLTKLGELLGLGSHQDILLSGSRDVAAVIAAVISVRLLLRARGAGTMRAIGFTLLAVVFLGPTMQPWYVAWSMVVLATIAEHRLRVLVIVLSCVSSFFGLPGEGKLVTEFGEANPFLIVGASIAIVLVLAIPLVIRVRRALQSPEPEPVLAVTRS